jgi:hypothetical protein
LRVKIRSTYVPEPRGDVQDVPNEDTRVAEPRAAPMAERKIEDIIVGSSDSSMPLLCLQPERRCAWSVEKTHGFVLNESTRDVVAIEIAPYVSDVRELVVSWSVGLSIRKWQLEIRKRTNYNHSNDST